SLAGPREPPDSRRGRDLDGRGADEPAPQAQRRPRDHEHLVGQGFLPHLRTVVPLPSSRKTATLAPMPGWIGFPELIVLLLVLLLIFGPKRLPEMGRSLGKGMREFKDSITGKDNEPDSSDSQQSLPVAPAEPVAAV